MLKRLLRDDVEADHTNIGPQESLDAGGVEIPGYLPETLLSMHKLDCSSNISNREKVMLL